jgi:hypothetical protein
MSFNNILLYDILFRIQSDCYRKKRGEIHPMLHVESNNRAAFMLPFTSGVLPPHGDDVLWGISERYLALSRERYQATAVGHRRYQIARAKEIDTQQPWYVIALKVASYCTIILPLLALGVRTLYRSHRTFVTLSSSNPKVDVPGAHEHGDVLAQPARENFELIETHNAQVIALIRAARDEGKEVALFLGRQPQQSVPDDGMVWVTFDTARPTDTPPTHPYLCMDFNAGSLASLFGCFDKVVVDCSVLKFFGGHEIYSRLKKLLQNVDTAELIVEYAPKVAYRPIPHPEYYVEASFMVLPYSSFDEEGRIIPFSQVSHDVHEEFARRTQLHLERLFNSVQFVKNSVYPCRGSEEQVIGDYWILRSPKGPSSWAHAGTSAR